MGRLNHPDFTVDPVLGGHTVIGRSEGCDLRLERATISAEHVSITWRSDRWYLRDLASLNGTRVNGNRVSPTNTVELSKGDTICLGGENSHFSLFDDASPRPFLRSAIGGKIIELRQKVVLLSDSETIPCSVYEAEAGTWHLESSESLRALETGCTIEVDGQLWLFQCPGVVEGTQKSSNGPPSVRESEIQFSVSLDEEFVEIDVRVGERRVRLGNKAAHYMLLILARARAGDSGGWMHTSEIQRQLKCELSQLNVWVHRLRVAFAGLGLADPAAVIERRAGTGQLRIGTHRVVETRC